MGPTTTEDTTRLVQQAGRQGYTPYAPGRPTPEQMKAIEEALSGSMPPDHSLSPASPGWKPPDNADLANRERQFYEFRQRLLYNKNADVDASLKEGKITPAGAAQQRAKDHEDFLNHTSPEKMDKTVRDSVVAELVEGQPHLNPDEHKKAVRDIMDDYQTSPERATEKAAYNARRQADLETGKKLKDISNSHLPDSNASTAMKDTGGGNQENKNLSDGKSSSPTPEAPGASKYEGSVHEILDRRLDDLFLDSELNRIYGHPKDRASAPSSEDSQGGAKTPPPPTPAKQLAQAQETRERADKRLKDYQELAGPNGGKRAEDVTQRLQDEALNARIKENDAQARVDQENAARLKQPESGISPTPESNAPPRESSLEKLERLKQEAAASNKKNDEFLQRNTPPGEQRPAATSPAELLASTDRTVVDEGVQKATAAEKVAHAAELERKLANAGVRTPTPEPGSIREKIVRGDLAGATEQTAENMAKTAQAVEPVAVAAEPPVPAAEPSTLAPEAPKVPESPHAPALPEGGSPHMGPVPEMTEGAHIKGKGGNLLTAAFGAAAAVTTLAKGGDATQSLESAAAATVPYYDAAHELAKGNTDAAVKSGILETAAWGIGIVAGGAASGAAASLALGAAAGMVGYETAKMIYETPERLRVAEGYANKKEAALSNIGDADEWASAHEGRPAKAAKTLEDPEALRQYEASLKNQGRDQDLKHLEEFKTADRDYVDAMKKFDIDVSPEKRESDRAVAVSHEFGF